MSTITSIMYMSGMIILGIIGIGVCSHCITIICFNQQNNHEIAVDRARQNNENIQSITVINPVLFSEKQQLAETEHKMNIIVHAVPIEIIDITLQLDDY